MLLLLESSHVPAAAKTRIASYPDLPTDYSLHGPDLLGSTRSKSVAAGPGRLKSDREGITSAGSSGSTTCDKCDGKHPTDRCPHFQKDREKHKDAWVNYGCKNNPHQMGGNPGNFVLRNARVIRQPGDGSCLYHSLSYGLGNTDARSLRRELAQFLRDRPDLEIAGDTLEEWVRWDSSSSVETYARRQSMSGWGGGIEMACCSHLKNVNIHVYESVSRISSAFKRISCFDAPKQDGFVRTVHVLYQGGLHYDALLPT
ncbi:OTU4 [Symbiodinium sp. CCMP2456]|nr:OTU4 [Symbiodinium sp. CCMP2456]